MSKEKIPVILIRFEVFFARVIITFSIPMKKDYFLSSSPINVINVVVYTGNIKRVNYSVWVVHNLERLGGRVANVGARAIYMATGERPETIPVAKETLL